MRCVILGGLTLSLLALAGFGAWLFSLPMPVVVEAKPVPEAEADALLAALKPRRERPLIAIIGINDATETTDYLVPAGILRRADIADVMLLATGEGPVKLFPALKVEPDATVARFDAAHPEGADYVVVPAMSRDDDPVVMAWLKGQAKKGATIIGICAGAKVVGAAGLLDGRRATTHWYYIDEMLKRSPTIRYVADRRMVADGRVVTTTGITASMPTMLTLIEAIAGRGKAMEAAQVLGVSGWNARHASGAFTFTRPFAATVLGNVLAVWNRDQVGIELVPGMDAVSLAFVADAWSRTYRSRVVTFAASGATVEGRGGIRILPDRVAATWPGEVSVSVSQGMRPATALDETLGEIAARYGARTADVVAMQLEYPRPATGR